MPSPAINECRSSWRRRGAPVILVAASLAPLLGAPTALGASQHQVASRLATCALGSPVPTRARELSSDASELSQLVEQVPCPTTGRASYATHDSRGGSMDALDPIDDPSGGYLGVYHTPFGSPAGANAVEFRISIAHSSDLIHWSALRVLDWFGAAMPTLRRVPATHGYLLAYEKAQSATQTAIRIRYYPNRGALLANKFSAQRDLVRQFSPYSNGTPSILSVAWHGGLRRSVITLAFHYNRASRGGPGPDREALGVLRGFRLWTAQEDLSVDELLIHAGFRGSHGDRRQFNFGGHRWRIYEAQTSLGNFAAWHLVLLDPASGRAYPVSMSTDNGTFSSSFGNPTVQVERAPTGIGRVLVVTMYVFRSGDAAMYRGELVYYQPL